MPAKCAAMLLECVVNSMTSPAEMVGMQAELQSAVSALFSGHESSSTSSSSPPPPPSDARGVDLADWLLRDMHSRDMRPRFEWDAGLWGVVLQGLARRVDQGSSRRPSQIARVRAFFNSMPMHNEFTHSTMLSVYRRVGMAAEADALRQQLMAVQLTAGLITARLGDLHLQLCRAYETAAMASLLAEADQLWRQAAQQPLQLMNHVTTMCMLKLHQHVGDIARQQSIIQEALDLERAAGNVKSEQPVFVDAAAFCMLFDSFARSP